MKRNKVILLVCIVVVLCVCCSQRQEKDVTFESKQPVLIDWHGITEKLKVANLKDLYIDMDEMETDINDFGCVFFSNYNPAVANSFMEVEYQVLISYGLIEKKDGSTYDEAMYEIIFTDNSSDQYYACVYSAGKELIYEEGSWFVDNEEKEQIITKYIDDLNLIMGVVN